MDPGSVPHRRSLREAGEPSAAEPGEGSEDQPGRGERSRRERPDPRQHIEAQRPDGEGDRWTSIGWIGRSIGLPWRISRSVHGLVSPLGAWYVSLMAMNDLFLAAFQRAGHLARSS